MKSLPRSPASWGAKVSVLYSAELEYMTPVRRGSENDVAMFGNSGMSGATEPGHTQESCVISITVVA